MDTSQVGKSIVRRDSLDQVFEEHLCRGARIYTTHRLQFNHNHLRQPSHNFKDLSLTIRS